MNEAVLKEEDLLDHQFGYVPYYGHRPQLGWLLNYHSFKDERLCWQVAMYFVDEHSSNFKVSCPFFPSFLIECRGDLLDVEEYIKRKYEGAVHLVETVERVDVKEYNHLSKPPKKLLKVHFRSDTGFQQCLKDIKNALAATGTSRHVGEVYSGFRCNQHEDGAVSHIVDVHEYDIPIDVQVGNFFGVRCGCWYSVSYNGEAYSIAKNDRMTHPDLRVMAFDIETTKPPLKFPNAEFDQVMMISILTEEFGELIVNRAIVSQDIQEFEYAAKDDMKGVFRVSNECTEEALLTRFIEVVQEHRPHIITTYNGGFFDWPFIDARMKKYKLDLEQTIQFTEFGEYYHCPFIVHLDCYKWVKRDSYLPMNNQGLKDVTRIKLGYFPDEIDPEDMVRLAEDDPQKLASYSVSDALSTYFLYVKYVHPHIFSMSTLVPLPPVHTLCKGSGTLCEALLLSEAITYNLLVPTRKRTGRLEYYKGHLVENLTYVGGHVESLQAGIFRSDFDSHYTVDHEMVEMIADNMDHILEEFVHSPDYGGQKQAYIDKLRGCAGSMVSRGNIYHLDVGAMYPNIILTNRLQPISVVNEDICVRCDFNDKRNRCRKRMEWISRAEYIPPGKNEVAMIKAQLESEMFCAWEHEGTGKVPYSSLSPARQEALLKERVLEYSRNIHKRVRKTEEKLQDIYICQREVPFYVETVRKFRDKRYVYKDLYKKAVSEYEKSPSVENKKSLVVYSSLQIAYKCVLNSFYGYVMREGSRWFSLEMAATVCHAGGQIIRLAKELMERIGTPLELDTDGIWGIIPSRLPCHIMIGGQTISMLARILNYFVCKKYTNYDYQILRDGKYEIVPQNSIFFEVDGPYKSMIIPSSTEENKLLKKRYVVFDNNNKIVELKGFELKRRGELNFIKKFQEDLFSHFNDGECLQECYDSIACVCNYWLDIIDSQGGGLDDESIFDLFSEFRSMSKGIEGYADRKSSILSTARRLSEFLGSEILGEKLKCEFIISKYPPNAPIVDRAIPVMIFKSTDKDVFLRRWLKSAGPHQLKEIIDWSYYRKRFESILQRLVVIPAYLQKVKNPVARVEVPSWIKKGSKKERLDFAMVGDIEDLTPKRRLVELFYTKEAKTDDRLAEQQTEYVPASAPSKEKADIRSAELVDFIEHFRSSWVAFYRTRMSFDTCIVKISYLDTGSYVTKYMSGREELHDFEREVYLEVADPSYFSQHEAVSKYVCSTQSVTNLVKMRIREDEARSERFSRFFEHFSISKVHNLFDPMYQILSDNDAEVDPVDAVIVSSFNYQRRPVYCVTGAETVFLSDLRHPLVRRSTLREYKDRSLKYACIVVFSRSDANSAAIRDAFWDYHHMPIELSASVFLDSLESLMRIHNDLHLRSRARFHQLLDISRLSRIPILNVDGNVLDYMLYKEFARSGILPVRDSSFSPSVVREELSNPGYYPFYCVQFECSNSLVLSIIEYKTFQADFPLYCGYDRKDFQVLRGFLKGIVVQALKQNSGARMLLERASSWVKRDSGIICEGLREVIGITHQRYLVNLISKLRQEQYSVISSSKELLIIGTDKKHLEGCNQFIEYTKRKVSLIPGYEFLSFKVVRVFERLGIVSPSSYFYMDKGEVLSFSETKIPLRFFQLYFSESPIRNDEVYDLVRHMDAPAVRVLLKLLSYKRDIHGLASNCYRLVGASEFEDGKLEEFNLVVFCKECGLENILRRRCLKCFSEIEKTSIEKGCLEYLRYCWKMQIDGDRFCDKCGLYEERRLKEYCRCGGRFAKRDYLDEVVRLGQFVGTHFFDEKVQCVLDYFK